MRYSDLASVVNAAHQMSDLTAQSSGATDMSITAFSVMFCYGSVQLIVNTTEKGIKSFRYFRLISTLLLC
jgi:hypothetical protein